MEWRTFYPLFSLLQRIGSVPFVSSEIHFYLLHVPFSKIEWRRMIIPINS
ncbi:hypothetical protein [Neobacillus mesonae]|nr:hypothetical protein [Neobacillus mesonae]